MHIELKSHQESSKQNLKCLSNEDLNSQLQSLVRQEREVLSDILRHIAEVDRRRLYLDMAYPNLFTYLTQHLGYSNGSAQRRIDAARLLREVPTLTDRLESGKINLLQVSVVQKAIRQKKKETKASSSRQNKDESQIPLETHDLAMLPGSLSAQEKRDLLEQLSGQSLEVTQQIVAQTLDLKIQQASQIRHQKDHSVRFEVTFSEEQWQKLQHMRELLSNSLPNGSWDQVLEYVADKVIAQRTKPAKPRYSPGAKTRGKSQPNAPKQATQCNNKPPATSSLQHPQQKAPTNTLKQKSQSQLPTNMLEKNSQTQVSAHSKDKPIPAAIKRQVQLRDLCCQYVDPKTNRQCAGKWNLQIDHIQPRWAGGSNEPQNLRVLCQQHNLHIYKQQAGWREQS